MSEDKKLTLKERQQGVWDGASMVLVWLFAVGVPVLVGCTIGTALCVLYGLMRLAMTWGQ